MKQYPRRYIEIIRKLRSRDVCRIGGDLSGRQDLQWPPYRVDNLTSLGIRYRQALSSTDAARVPAAKGSGDAEGELPWDSLGPQAIAPYSWDQPSGDSRVLAVGFEQVGS